MNRIARQFMFGLCLAASAAQAVDTGSAIEIVAADEVDWGALNPLRGEHSPRAANLWGDRSQDTATGMLVRFADGFASPPHIHNIRYRGVVIRGRLHNDDPGAARHWLPTGSYWTQPAGEAHITAAQGGETLAYIEIERGPYRVMPSADAFDSGERAINVDRSNLVWLGADELRWIDAARPVVGGKAPRIALLWSDRADPGLRGSLLELPAGFVGVIESGAGEFRAVLIEGGVDYRLPDSGETRHLAAGSYFGSQRPRKHLLSSGSDPALVYLRTSDRIRISPTSEHWSREP